MRLVDSHCHLNAERFEGDEEAVLERALAAGLERILVPGWNRASSERALELVARFEWLDASVGVHPHGRKDLKRISALCVEVWHPTSFVQSDGAVKSGDLVRWFNAEMPSPPSKKPLQTKPSTRWQRTPESWGWIMSQNSRSLWRGAFLMAPICTICFSPKKKRKTWQD